MPSRPEAGLAVRWRLVGGRPVRSLVTGTARAGIPELVLVPGLGAAGYLVPVARACAGWTRVHLLDLPGFGHRVSARLPADLVSTARTLTDWLAAVPDAQEPDAAGPDAPVLLLGHSTGAQVALRAALDDPRPVGRLVLAGASFAPGQRRLARLAGPVARTLPHEQSGELPAVLPYYRRGLRRLPALLGSALADAPEEALGALAPPLLVLRGEHDRLCPARWATALAGRAPDGRALQLPGGHNFPWTAPELTAQVLHAAAGAPPTAAPGSGV